MEGFHLVLGILTFTAGSRVRFKFSVGHLGLPTSCCTEGPLCICSVPKGLSKSATMPTLEERGKKCKENRLQKHVGGKAVGRKGGRDRGF